MGSDTIRLRWSMYSLQGQLEKCVISVSHKDTWLHGLTYLSYSIFAIGAIKFAAVAAVNESGFRAVHVG